MGSEVIQRRLTAFDKTEVNEKEVVIAHSQNKFQNIRLRCQKFGMGVCRIHKKNFTISVKLLACRHSYNLLVVMQTFLQLASGNAHFTFL